MAYIKITNGNQEQYTIGQLRRDNPNVSFPKTLSADTLAAYNVFEVVTADMPEFDPFTQKAETGAEAVLVDDQWTWQWNISAKSADEQEKYSKYMATQARNKRDELLKECDWTQVSDAPVDQSAWATYRQELRDITAQDNFPADITWPEKP